jgi:hypothetical protein
MRALDNPKRL